MLVIQLISQFFQGALNTHLKRKTQSTEYTQSSVLDHYYVYPSLDGWLEAESFQSAACYQNRVFPSIDFLAFAAAPAAAPRRFEVLLPPSETPTSTTRYQSASMEQQLVRKRKVFRAPVDGWMDGWRSGTQLEWELKNQCGLHVVVI